MATTDREMGRLQGQVCEEAEAPLCWRKREGLSGRLGLSGGPRQDTASGWEARLPLGGSSPMLLATPRDQTISDSR